MLGDEHRAVREILGDCAALAENNASELRSLAYDLHAPWLQYGGLLSGIQEYTRQFSIRTGISVSFEPPPAIPRLQPMKEMALYRVMQESLMNVHRHSGAKRAWIVVSLLDNELRMTIRDEGGGGTPASNRIGVGILSMHERMSAIGGRLDVCRKPEGVSTLAILPLVEEKYYGDS
jgi:signal transduction histidine kinase